VISLAVREESQYRKNKRWNDGPPENGNDSDKRQPGACGLIKSSSSTTADLRHVHVECLDREFRASTVIG